MWEWLWRGAAPAAERPARNAPVPEGRAAAAADSVRPGASSAAHSSSERSAPEQGELAARYQTVCELRDEFLRDDPTVKFLLAKLEEAGCQFDASLITVEHCSERILGAFTNPKVELCYNHYHDSPVELRNTLVHELIHAYDQCRAADIDLTNCKHLACSEIRAARLSGDCSAQMEWSRSGRLPWPGYEKACVRRRAELSVGAMPQCKLSACAAVMSCFDACYNDTEPFSRPP